MPVISPNTNTRAEGYFRLEWKLAVDRSHLMADDAPFLFPIVVGDVNDATARVPDKFREVQWTRLRLDETPAELAARVARLLAGEAVAGLGEAGPGSPTPATTRHRTKEKSGFEKWWWLIFPVIGMTMALIQTLKLAGRVAKLLSREAVAGLGEAGPGSPTPATTRHRTKEKTGFEKWWWLIFPVFGMTMALIQTLKREPGHPARPAAGGDHAVLWGEPLPLHTLENVGSAELHVISVELKDAAARVNL